MICDEKIYTLDEFKSVVSFIDFEKLPKPKGNQSKINCEYCKNFATFDIETTRIKKIEQSIMYLWQFCFAGKYTILGRTWSEFIDLINFLSIKIGDLHFIIYVHNLSYEFSFLKGIFKFKSEDVFAIEKRKILKCKLGNIEFRCSALLSNMKLETFTQEMKVFHVKLVDTIDYDVERYPYTILDEEVIKYSCFDIWGLYEALIQKMELCNDTLYTIPLTSTGYVRRDVKTAMSSISYRNVRPIFPNEKTYLLLRQAFRGGDTHANRLYAGKILTNVKSYDRISSYPDVLINCKFPVSKFEEEKCYDIDYLSELIEIHKKAVLMKVVFYNIEIKGAEIGCPYIPYDKCTYTNNEIRDNGRILTADELEITITDVDWKIIINEYNFEHIEILELYSARYAYLPYKLISVLLKYYQNKTELKHVKGYELLYALNKALLNAIYGLMAQNPVKYPIVYNENDRIFEENKKIIIHDELLKAQNKSFVAYQWGVWCTAWARYRLHELIYIAGEKFIYCDTDSVKVVGDIDSQVKKYNMKRIKDSKDSEAYAKSPEGIIYYMGAYELDGEYKKFITLGAKKYAYVDKKDKLHVTVSGVSKEDGAKELKKIENFKPGFTFSKAGGLEAVYNDNINKYYITSDGIKIHVTDNVVLRPSTYTLGITAEYDYILSHYQSLYHNPIDKLFAK